MVPRRLEPGTAPCRRFFLDASPLDGAAELAPRDLEHALRVLRLRAGDAFIGLDGRGRSWPMRIASVEKMRARIECTGAAELEPRAGEPGAALDWIEIALVLPRGGRAEDIVDAATQLGAAAIRPIEAERARPEARRAADPRIDRLRRAAIEACKQGGRAWLPEISLVQPLDAWLAGGDGDRIWLSPRAPITLSGWLDARATTPPNATRVATLPPCDGLAAPTPTRWSESSPLRLFVGPEGGFTAREEAELAAQGATAVSLGPHTLRIETAALAALAIATEHCFTAIRT